LGSAPYENLGLPFHNYCEGDIEPIPEREPFEMVFDLLPTSYQFQKGSRMRIAIVFAVAGNFDTPVLDPPPTVNLLRNPEYLSYVELPVIENPQVVQRRKK